MIALLALAQEVVPPINVPLTSNAQVWIAAIGALATVCVAFMGVLISVMNGRKANDLIVKVDQVHTLTNANLTAANNAKDAALQALTAAQEMIVQLRLEKRDTDSARTASDVRTASALATPVASQQSGSNKAVEATLDRIEENTAATAMNTEPERN